jgi:hypothetical protein
MKAKITYIQNEEEGSRIIEQGEVYMAHKMNESQFIDAIKELYSDAWMPEVVSVEVIKEEKVQPKSSGKVRHLGYGEDERGGRVYVNRA